jgi:hypothetical protein
MFSLLLDEAAFALVTDTGETLNFTAKDVADKEKWCSKIHKVKAKSNENSESLLPSPSSHLFLVPLSLSFFFLFHSITFLFLNS